MFLIAKFGSLFALSFLLLSFSLIEQSMTLGYKLVLQSPGAWSRIAMRTYETALLPKGARAFINGKVVLEGSGGIWRGFGCLFELALNKLMKF